MSSKGIVRQSKYRHVFGTQFKNENSYLELRPNIGAQEACNYIKANSSFFAIPWSGGGGSMAVISHADVGKRGPDQPVINGHSAQIADFDFNPFNDHILATASADATVKIWGIPEGGIKETITTPLVTLDGHEKKLNICQFHNTSNNVLLTSDVNASIILWDIETGKQGSKITEGHTGQLHSVSFNRDGSLFVSTAKDKKIRIYDPRVNKPQSEVNGHEGLKASRAVWMGKLDRIFTCGFAKAAERQYMIWDPRNMEKALTVQSIDSQSGILMPFYDDDSNILYLGGKGDGNVRFYEMVGEEPYAYSISEFKSTQAAAGLAMLPKIACDTTICEVTRLYKLTSNAVLPIMFQVPRKAETFQADLYPDTVAPEASQTAEEFFSGKNTEPKTASMKPGENNFKSVKSPSAFVPKVEAKAVVKLPPKTADPKELAAQNEELRKRVEALEIENFDLKKKVASLSGEASGEATPVSP